MVAWCGDKTKMRQNESSAITSTEQVIWEESDNVGLSCGNDNGVQPQASMCSNDGCCSTTTTTTNTSNNPTHWQATTPNTCLLDIILAALMIAL